MAHCDLCDVPRAMCAHGLENRQMAPQNRQLVSCKDCGVRKSASKMTLLPGRQGSLCKPCEQKRLRSMCTKCGASYTMGKRSNLQPSRCPQCQSTGPKDIYSIPWHRSR